ncbi:MAG: hypothetical protein K9J12_17305 [Melioribacteraceae bacterium]|nr:hypothetical protein [Melioribacteraceae bacterium]MCF8263449.1 hypothetical protein [Melioribacteraceae bacterium]MCF8414039.1 hypothetical protein [Melioribacteraceae bacterium]MCF8431006.1 hypothetical protein [Melioribacteraceae bacterium]
MDLFTWIVVILAVIALIGLFSFGFIIRWFDKKIEKESKITSPLKERRRKEAEENAKRVQQPQQQQQQYEEYSDDEEARFN